MQIKLETPGPSPLQEMARVRSSKERRQIFTADFGYVTRIWLTLLIIGIVAYPFTSALFPQYPDSGYIFAKIIGLAFFSFVNWYLVMMRVIKFTRKNIAVGFAIVGSVMFLLPLQLQPTLRLGGLILTEEVIFFLILTVLCYLRAFRPQLNYQTEGYTDFGLLNRIDHSHNLPPEDVWFADKKANYYWYGYYATAYLGKIAGVPVGVMYNIALALSPALATLTLFSISTFILGSFFGVTSPLMALIPALLTIFSVSPHALLLFTNRQANGKIWLLKIRDLIPRTYVEHPHYSFVIGDLRGHLTNLPIVITLFALIGQIIFVGQTTPLFLATISLLLAISYMTNPSDWAVFTGSLLMTTAASYFLSSHSGLQSNLVNIALVFSLMYVFLYPYLINFKSFFNKIALLTRSTTAVQDAILMWGWWFVPFAAFLLYIIVAGTSIADSLLTITLPLASFDIGFMAFVGLGLTLSLGLIALVEFVWVKDIYQGRWNTFYKFNHITNTVLPFLSLTFAVILTLTVNPVVKGAALIFLAGNFALLAYFPMLLWQWFGTINPRKYVGLDASLGLEVSPNDKQIVTYLLGNWSEKNVIAEYPGKSFTPTAFISAYSATPTIVGWQTHQWLWRGDLKMVQARQEEVRQLYEGNSEQKRAIINRYGINYIVISDRERLAYPRLNLAEFTDIGEWVVESNNCWLLRVGNGKAI